MDIKNSGYQKIRKYCNTCRATLSTAYISEVLNAHFNPKQSPLFEPATVHLPSDDSNLLAKNKIWLVGAHNEFRTPISYEKACVLVTEHAARIVNPLSIKLILDKQSLKKYVLWRDTETCKLCGAPGQHVMRRKPKELGGLRTPDNLIVVCETCKAHPVDRSNIFVHHMDSDKIEMKEEFPNLRAMEIHCYCDISRVTNAPSTFGMAVVVATISGIHIYTKVIEQTDTNTAVAEAKAVLWANELAGHVTRGRVIIYSDVDFSRYVHPRSLKMRILLVQMASCKSKIVHLNLTAPHKSLHALAHKYARTAARIVTTHI